MNRGYELYPVICKQLNFIAKFENTGKPVRSPKIRSVRETIHNSRSGPPPAFSLLFLLTFPVRPAQSFEWLEQGGQRLQAVEDHSAGPTRQAN